MCVCLERVKKKQWEIWEDDISLYSSGNFSISMIQFQNKLVSKKWLAYD